MLPASTPDRGGEACRTRKTPPAGWQAGLMARAQPPAYIGVAWGSAASRRTPKKGTSTAREGTASGESARPIASRRRAPRRRSGRSRMSANPSGSTERPVGWGLTGKVSIQLSARTGLQILLEGLRGHYYIRSTRIMRDLFRSSSRANRRKRGGAILERRQFLETRSSPRSSPAPRGGETAGAVPYASFRGPWGWDATKGPAGP